MSLVHTSLLDLAREIKKLHSILQRCTDRAPTPEEFEDLRVLINSLQATCPNQSAVLQARITWLEMGLNSFERYVVAAAEAGQDINQFDLHLGGNRGGEELLIGVEHINHFLRRSYLKDSFPRLYRRTLSLYQRLASVETIGRGKQEYLRKAIAKMEDKLLEGQC